MMLLLTSAFSLCSQLLLMLVLMLLAQGWTVRDPLISGNRRLLAIWGGYGVISVLLYVWNLVSSPPPPLPPRAWNLISSHPSGLQPGQSLMVETRTRQRSLLTVINEGSTSSYTFTTP